MSTAAVETKRMTAEEFCEFVHKPENANRWFELVRGEVIELPPPMKLHGVVCGNLSRMLGNFCYDRRKGYVTGNDSGVILARDPDMVRGPDVAVYEDAQSWEELHPKYGEVPPRLAVEVVSPNDKPGKLTEKTADYLASGVELVWVIDPEERHIAVYRKGREHRIAREGDEVTGEDVLPGLTVKVSDCFLVPGGGAARPASPAPTASPPPPAGSCDSPGTAGPGGP
jgi:Uma2 family endonuclease